MLDKLLKTITITFLIFSILVLFYTAYKSEIIYSGEKHHYYIKYYALGFLLLIFSIISFFIKNELKGRIYLIFFSIIFSFYLLESLFIINKKIFINNNSQINIQDKNLLNYDKRTKIEVYEDEKKLNDNVYLYISPIQLVKLNDAFSIVPLSSISNSKTINCNEDGYYSIYHSDRYGFNNPNNEWEKEIIDFVLIGDSFAHGDCVNETESIAGNLRKLINIENSVLNFGHSGFGPLTEYATLKEYLPFEKEIKNIVWLYYEANDLINLSNEFKNNVLVNYFTNPDFSQNLKLKQDKIDIMLKSYFLKLYNEEKNEEKNEKKIVNNFKKNEKNFINFVKLYQVRKNIIDKFIGLPDPNFEKILKLTKKLAEQNNVKLHFVYIPEPSRYKNKLFLQDSSRKYKKIIKIVKNLKISTTDLNKELMQKHVNPLSLYSNSHVHNNKAGYKLIAETIFNNIKQ